MFKFSNSVYNPLKFIAQIALPAVGALYFGLAGIWHLPNADQVVGTITVVDTFLGVLLGFSTASYNQNVKYDGNVDVEFASGPDDKTSLTFDLSVPPDKLRGQDSVTFKINPS